MAHAFQALPKRTYRIPPPTGMRHHPVPTLASYLGGTGALLVQQLRRLQESEQRGVILSQRQLAALAGVKSSRTIGRYLQPGPSLTTALRRLEAQKRQKVRTAHGLRHHKLGLFDVHRALLQLIVKRRHQYRIDGEGRAWRWKEVYYVQVRPEMPPALYQRLRKALAPATRPSRKGHLAFARKTRSADKMTGRPGTVSEPGLVLAPQREEAGVSIWQLQAKVRADRMPLARYSLRLAPQPAGLDPRYDVNQACHDVTPDWQLPEYARRWPRVARDAIQDVIEHHYFTWAWKMARGMWRDLPDYPQPASAWAT